MLNTVQNNQDSLESLAGVVERFLFHNAESNFAIFILKNRYGEFTAKGYIPNIQMGQEIKITGQWISHAKFGKQFDVKSCSIKLPTTTVGLKKYLSSGLIKGIGPSYAERLVNHFGVEILNIIDSNPEKLKEVTGIGDKRIEKIIDAWKHQKDIADIMVFLQEKGITVSLATKIYKKYGQESIAVLKENPYRLADEIWGVGFKLADEIAQKLDFHPHCIQRVAAGILFVISSATQNGHLYIELQNLKDKTYELLGLPPDKHDLVKKSLHNLYEKEKIKFISTTNHYITLTPFFYCEKGIANKLKNLLSKPSKFNFNIDKIYNDLRVEDSAINLNEDQQRGVINCLQNKISIITGGPGTGKTTLIKKLLSILDENRVIYHLAAPTGRAAKRITESTGKYAVTLHRLLEFDVGTMGFKHNENNSIKTDFVIIDEASMIDVFLAHALLKAMPYQAHLVFLGDIDQLPSVGAGNVLNDLISSQKIPCVKLTQIFRQAQDSLIVVNAHRINHGEFPVMNLPDSKKDFVFIKEENPEEIINHLKRIFFIELTKKNISRDNCMVLTPMNRGVVGTFGINQNLQQLLNPDKQDCITFQGTTFKVHDKVMQIRNNYEKHVYNGDIGTIDSIDMVDKEIAVAFSDKKVVIYDFDELNELVLAYSISIHKSQGSEFDVIVVPLFMQHFMLLQRNLVYTALTRAKKFCYFIGQPKALAIAIRTAKSTERLTFLKKFLQEDYVE